jgi:phospholipase/lecithinase/hemolysin
MSITDNKTRRMIMALAFLALLAACPFSGLAITAIVAFGDSYTDTGNAPSSPPDYYDGRFSNGPLWIEYLSQSFGFDYDFANNYAVSGTESDELGVAIAKYPGTTDSSEVLFAIWSGNNDFLAHLDIGTNDVTWSNSIVHTVSSLTTSCGLLYQKGARNLVLFNQLDITQLPYVRGSYSTAYGDYLRGKINTLNSLLESSLGAVIASNPGLQIYTVDTYDDFNTLLANFASYGFSNDTIGAINDPNLSSISFTGPGADYVFWDSQHPTTKAHSLIAGWVATVVGLTAPALLTVETQGKGTITPNYNGKSLLVGQSYSMTATAAAGFAFAGWTDAAGTVLTNARQLHFTMSANLTLIATFADVTPPTVAVTPPATEVAEPALLAKGTARDNVGVAAVFCQLNAGGWNPVASANGFTNWTTNLILTGGANIVQFYSADLAGNLSKTSSVSVFYVTTTPLTLATNGSGKITRGFAGDLLIVGKPYDVTAVPAVNNLFSNWSGTGPAGSFTLASNPLTFLMQSNMVLTANFVANPFLQAAGNYNGLFYVVATGVAEETAGLLNHLIVSSLGAYSGQLLIGGQSYSFSGRFNVAGVASVAVPRLRPAGPLLLEMTLDWNTLPCQLTGSVSGTNGGSWTAGLAAEQAGIKLASGQYTMLVPPLAAEPNSPPGYGYATMTDRLGMVTLSGALADGASFNQTVAVSPSGDLPVYASLYNHAGLLLGWINLSNQSPADVLIWIKPASKTLPSYRGGFTNNIQPLVSPWTNPPPGVAAIALANGQLNIAGVNGQAPQLSYIVQVNTKNALVKTAGGSPANSLTGSINPKNGLLTIAFGNDTGRATTNGVGAVLQNTTNAGGFFLGATNAGSIALDPVSP